MRFLVSAITLAGFCSLVHANDLLQLNTTAMQPGYCFAGSRPDEKALGVNFRSSNGPKDLGDLIPGIDGAVSLLALPSDHVPFNGRYRGFKLLLINRSGAEVAFSACDSRVSIVCEASTDGGQWKEIEYLPQRSRCGNSYHRVFLPNGHYWEFSAPAYSGETKAKLRFKFSDRPVLYSNEFDGSINSGQFVRPIPDPDPPYFVVFGQVQRQGKYEFAKSDKVTISQAIARAGGFAPQARRNELTLVRKAEENSKPVYIKVDMETMVEGKQVQDIMMQPRDVIIVREKKDD